MNSEPTSVPARNQTRAGAFPYKWKHHHRKICTWSVYYFIIYYLGTYKSYILSRNLKMNTPSVSKYLSLLTFLCNFDHSSYSKNYCKHVK
jgi:hypothetical protein